MENDHNPAASPEDDSGAPELSLEQRTFLDLTSNPQPIDIEL